MIDKSYSGAVRLLPPALRENANKLEHKLQLYAEELRLRAGFPLTVLLPEGGRELGSAPVSPRDLEAVLEIATSASAHSVRETVRAGYVNASGGYRLGLCGSVTADAGGVTGFHALSSIAIRIPREFPGSADKIALACGGEIPSTLIIAPPGAGKTTLLRDLVRLTSDGCERLGVEPRRVGLCDERGEVAAVASGAAQMDVGRRTDVLSGAPKSAAAMMLVRTMNPEIVALDEITAPEDVTAIEYAANCGVTLFATVHAGNLDELRGKPLYRRLLDARIFELGILIKKFSGTREYEVARL
ncbi:MAG: stage III sporulation protein AB [Oscillospiraceae bacterium]|nr:stage III sporulation protein AB [Oscillospiraceae bacterium]